MMTKRFVVLLDPCTTEQETAIREYMKGKKGWWHWLPNSWLLVDPSGVLTAAAVRDDIMALLSNQNMMILEFSDNGTYTWAGRGPKSDQKDMFKWFHETWKHKPPT